MGVPSPLLPYKPLLLRPTALVRGSACVCREPQHRKGFRAASNLMFGDLFLFPSLCLHPSISNLPLIYTFSFSESKRHSQAQTPAAPPCSRHGSEPVSSPRHPLMLRSLDDEQGCVPGGQHRALVSDARIALTPDHTGTKHIQTAMQLWCQCITNSS